MTGKGFTPNNNGSVIRMLSLKLGAYNKGRNRILMAAVILCVVTLTMVFGTVYGRLRAEYLKSIREEGTAASARIENGDLDQYHQVRSLGYVRYAGRSVTVGAAYEQSETGSGEKAVCSIRWLDEEAWDHIVSPAYTDIHGEFPSEVQEIMLSERTLKALNIDSPQLGDEIRLNVSVGLFRTVQETFTLCGWFTEYGDAASDSAPAYISQTKLEEWGLDPGEKADILICPSGSLQWRETEDRLYRDIELDGGQRISVWNSAAYDAVSGLAGGYGMAAVGALVILCGMFFLIYNVMQISMMEDVRQMGLLNIVGTTEKQIRKVYYGQIRWILIPGILAGTVLSVLLLQLVISAILGRQYLDGFGGAGELRIFRPEILAVSVIFTAVLTLGTSAAIIRRAVNRSCVESIHYTGLKAEKRRRKVRTKSVKRKKKNGQSAGSEIRYMAWKNLTRSRGKFILTVLSLFLGIEALLGAAVITEGSDYVHVIEERPDFLIAGEFSSGGQESGYGKEYRSRDAGEDPMLTEGRNLELLYDNEYDEFSPISREVREQLLALDGVDRENSYVMEGAYMYSVLSEKAVRPFVNGQEFLSLADGGISGESGEDAGQSREGKTQSVEGTAQSGEEGSAGTGMIEGALPDVIQILTDEETEELVAYVEKNSLSADMENFLEGNGVIILHDHALSPEQQEMADEAVGEPVYFRTLASEEDRIRWNRMTDEERKTGETDGGFGERQSEKMEICGYLDNRAEGFPDIRQTWHGAEGDFYYLISEKGFRKLPTEKKTLYMEINMDAGIGVNDEQERHIENEIESIISEENQRRAQITDTGIESGTAEAGIFCISKSALMQETAGYIRGNRIVLGGISAVLLLCGLANYFNVMVTGIFARRREFQIMESVGMTGKQRRQMLLAEGVYYCLIVLLLMLTAGNVILAVIRTYMEGRLSYFVFSYPFLWAALAAAGLAGICLCIPAAVCRRFRPARQKRLSRTVSQGWRKRS